MDNAKDEEGPRKYKEKRDVAPRKEEEDGRDSVVLERRLPEMKFSARVNGKKSEGDEDFGPVPTNIFFEDVEDFAHWVRPPRVYGLWPRRSREEKERGIEHPWHLGRDVGSRQEFSVRRSESR